MARTRMVGIDLAGFRVAIERPDGLPWAWPELEPHPRASTLAPDVYVGVRVGRCDEPVRDGVRYALAGRPGAAVEVGRAGDDWLVAVHGPGGCERQARFDRGLREGEVCVAPSGLGGRGLPPCPLAHPLDEVLLLQRLVRDGGIAVAGQAWATRRGATVLLGRAPAPAAEAPLGGGLRAAVVLRLEDGGVRVHGTRDRGAEAPLACSLRLERLHVTGAGAFTGSRPGPEEAVDALLSHALTPAHDPAAAERALEVAAQISRQVRLVELALPEARPGLPLAWGQPAAALGFAPPAGP